MKNMKRLLAVLLAVVMCLSCLTGLSFADESRGGKMIRPETRDSVQPAEEPHGFQSREFQLRNSYKYADDEIVTAIVLLKGEAPAELPEAQRAAAAARIAAQHNTLRNALREAKISYAEEFEYDSLLNGMSISVAYGDLEKIASISSVKAVYIANEYAAPVLEPATRMDSSNVMTGTANFQLAGYKGEGMLIAVLDTGITPDHEAFQVYGDKLGEIALNQEDAEAFIEEKGYGTYLSDKVPFSFDYYDQDDDATDDTSGHGTHVSGIAAGYAETEEGEIKFNGTAPYAQIAAMKIFSSNPANRGTNSGIYFAALEDCYELGVDVINMSIGAQNGFTYDPELEDEVFGNVYQTLEDNGIICSVAAGNEYNMAQYSQAWPGAGYVTSDYTDYGVVGSPSTYDGNLSVASLENEVFPGYVLKAGEKDIPYYDSDGSQFYDALKGMEDVEYVVIDGFGAAENYTGVDVKGKIALVSRGDITFQEKVQFAGQAGALACLVYNNQPGIIYMSISNYYCPAASISQEDGEYLKSIAVMPEVEPEEPDPNPDDTGAVAPTTRGALGRVSIEVKNVESTREPVKAPVRDHAAAEDLIYGCYFESEDEVADWTFVDKDGDGFNWEYFNNTEATGNKMTTYEGEGLIFSASYDNDTYTALTPDNWAISPAINLDGIEEASVSFWAVGQDASYCQEVFAIYAGIEANPETMTKLAGDFTATGEYVNYLADLSDFAGETIYVAVRHYNVSDMFMLNVDQFEIVKGKAEMPPDPSDIGGEVVKGFYFEEEPTDWTFVDKDGDEFNWTYHNNTGLETGRITAYEGEGLIYSKSYDNDTSAALTPDNWAISPAIDLSEVDDGVLSLYACGQDPSYAAEVFAVYAGTEADPEKMEMISDGDIVATGVYTRYIFDLSAYAGETIYVAIRHYNVTDMFYLNVDQVEVLTGTSFTPPEPPEPVARPVGTMSFPEEPVILDNPDGWKMSDFSSWGATPSLTLKPHITGVGGDVYSASFNTTDKYEVMSGTSMATPNMTGMMALVSEYVQENIAGTADPAEVENPFTDVKDDDYFFDPVMWAVAGGVTQGTDPDKFSPNASCTRAQIVTFLWRAYGEAEPTTTENPFTDVADGAYYFKPVLWAVENKITSGTAKDKFSPNATCTRAQAVTFLYRAAGEPEPTSSENPFTDVAEGQYYYNAVLWAVEKGVTQGTSETTFSPSNKCTRGQIVTFLYRALYQEASGELTKPERAALTEALAESTAQVLANPDSGDPYSPRKQGAGLANMDLLTAANAYIDEPIQNLFDNADGEFEFTFTVKDLYGNGGTYELTPLVMTNRPAAADLDENGEPEVYLAANEIITLATEPYEDGGETYPADVEVDAPETVTVPANGEVEVTVKITLTDETKEFLDAYFPNGAYIEGYIFLDAVEGEEITEEIHATYLGYYGDWTKAPILEQYDWRDIVDAANFVNNEAADDEGNTYADYGYTYLDAVDFQVTTDVSLAYAINTARYEQGSLYGGFAGDNLFGYDPELTYNDAHIAIAPGTGIIDMLYMAPYSLRNARHLIMVATNAETGEVYYVDDTEWLPKAYYDTDNGYWANTGTFIYDGTDAEGKVLENGTKVNLTYYANLPYGEDALGAIIGEDGAYDKLLEEAKDYVVWEIPVAIDTEAPVFVGYEYNEETNEITVTAKDNNYVAAIIMADENDNVLETKLFSEEEAGKEVSATFTFPAGKEYVRFYIEDYATNEGSGTGFPGDPVYVTINFAHPEGTELVDGEEELVVALGTEITLPTVEGETEKGVFAEMWCDEDFGDMDVDTLSLYYYFGMINLFFNDETLVAEKAMDGITLYPVYEIDESTPGVYREEEPIYSWSFEAEDEGWTLIDADGDGNNWTWNGDPDSYYVYDGDGCLFSCSYAGGEALTPDNWAISPAIDLSAAEAASVSLWARGELSSWCEENFAVYAGEEADPEKMTKVSEDITGEDTYTNYVADLSEFAGKTIYVAIRHYDVTDMYALDLDKVEVFDSVVETEVPAVENYTYTTQPNGAPAETVDTTALEAKLEEAKALNAEDYTEDSFAALTAAITAAEAVLADEEATQEDVDDALADLTAAIEGLVEAEVPPVPAGYVLSTELKDGDKVVIYSPKAALAMSKTLKNTYYREGVAVTIEDGAIAEPDATAIWTVELTEDGFKLKDDEGNYLSMQGTYNSIPNNQEHDVWKIDTDEAGNCYLVNVKAPVGSSGDPKAIEYYNNQFTGYYLTKGNEVFILEFYVLAAEG